MTHIVRTLSILLVGGLASVGCTDPPPPAPMPVTASVPIAAVRDAGGAVLLVTTGALPPATGAPGCRAGEAEPVVTDEGATITLTVRVPADRWSGLAGCPDATPREVAVPLPAPLAGRPLRTDVPIGVWVAAPDGTHARCVRPQCDPGPLDPPPTVTCTGSELARAALAGTPRRSSVVDERCRDRYAVLTVDVGAGACPVTDDGPSPCAGQAMGRGYFYAVGDSWRLVSRDAGAGCGDVHEVVPEFPADLCADLAPLANGGDWGGG